MKDKCFEFRERRLCYVTAAQRERTLPHVSILETRAETQEEYANT